jgi:hypothetical protein
MCVTDAVGVLGTLFGVVIGWLLNLCTVNHTVKKQEFYKAAATFRSAFTEEYRTLKAIVSPEDMSSNLVKTTLANAAAKHEIACILFRPYLSYKRKQRFDQAWKDYLCPEGGNVADLPSPYIDYCEIGPELALEKLEKLMEFGKPI